MNWGWKIVIAFSLFGVFIGGMVFRSFQMNIDLVSEDYYQQEVAYQQRIDKMTNEQALSVPLTFSQSSSELAVQFPTLSDEQVQGTIHLFRPSDARFDRVFTIALDSEQQQIINTNELVKGYYKVKVDWQRGKSEYYTEESIYVR